MATLKLARSSRSSIADARGLTPSTNKPVAAAKPKRVLTGSHGFETAPAASTLQPASKMSKVQHAQHVLRTLEGASPTSRGEVRKRDAALLTGYYASALSTAKALAPEYPGQVKAFLDAVGDEYLPGSIRSLAEAAIGVTGVNASAVKPAAPAVNWRRVELLPGERHYWSWKHVPVEERSVEVSDWLGVEFVGSRLLNWTASGAYSGSGHDHDWTDTLLKVPGVGVFYAATTRVRNYGNAMAKKVALLTSGARSASFDAIPESFRKLRVSERTEPGTRASELELTLLGKGIVRHPYFPEPVLIDSLVPEAAAAVRWYERTLHEIAVRPLDVNVQGQLKAQSPIGRLVDFDRLVDSLADSDLLTRPGALASLTAHLEASSSPESIVARLLPALFERDAARVIPLGEAPR